MFYTANFPGYRQLDQMDCGPTCLKILAEFFGRKFQLDYLREISFLKKGGASLAGLAGALEEMGIESVGITANMEELINDVPLPAIAHWNNNHFIVVYKANRKVIYVSDPALGKLKYTHQEFRKKWSPDNNNSGILLLVEPTEHFFQKENPEQLVNNAFNFLLQYLLPYKKYLNQVLLGLLITTVVQILLPFLTQSLVDYGINYENINFIYIILFAQLFLFITRSASEVIREWILLYISTKVNIEMISDFLEKLLKLPVNYFESKTTGDFLQRIYDHQRIDEFISGRALLFPFDVITIVTFAVVLSFFDSTVTGIFIIGTSLFFGWSLIFMRKNEILDHQLFDLSRKEQSLFLQIILAVTEIKLNSSEERRKLEWEENKNNLFSLQGKILKVNQGQMNGGRFIIEFTNILILFWSAKAVIAGDITLGSMLAIQFIMGNLFLPISNTIDFLVGFQRAVLSMERLSEVHNQKIEETNIRCRRNFKPQNIKIENLSFGYGESFSTPILKNINVTIPAQRVTAIVGSSGSGKTTLLKLLLKIYKPEAGAIKVGDINLEEINSTSWRNSCGAVMQEGIIFNDSIERNITESKSTFPTDKKLLDRSVEMARLKDLVEQSPLGYKMRIGEQGQLLSGGEKQRILIARALYKNPSFLFFDEATSSLDAESERLITYNLQSFYKNRTVVIIAHRLSTVMNADQILVMERGEIIEKGNHEELWDLKGSYFNLVKNQLKA